MKILKRMALIRPGLSMFVISNASLMERTYMYHSNMGIRYLSMSFIHYLYASDSYTYKCFDSTDDTFKYTNNLLKSEITDLCHA